MVFYFKNCSYLIQIKCTYNYLNHLIKIAINKNYLRYIFKGFKLYLNCIVYLIKIIKFFSHFTLIF